MNYQLFLIMALFVNTFLAALFPTQLGLDDPFGIDSIRTQQFNDFDSNTQAYFVEQGVFNADGTPGNNFETYQSLQTVGQGQAGIVITELGFGFTDYLKVAWNSFVNLGVFMIAFIVILFQLPLSIGIFIAPIFSTLGIFSLVKFIIGR